MIDWNSPPWSKGSSPFPSSIWDVLGQALSVAGGVNQARYAQDEQKKRQTQQDARQRFDDLWRVFQTQTSEMQKMMWPRLQTQAKEAGIDLSGVDFQPKPDLQEQARNAHLLDMEIAYYTKNPDQLTPQAQAKMDQLFKLAYPGVEAPTVTREISPAIPGGGAVPRPAVTKEIPFYVAGGGEQTAEQYLKSRGRQDIIDRLKAIGQDALLLQPIKTPEDEANFGREIAPYMAHERDRVVKQEEQERERQREQAKLETVTLPNGAELKNLTPAQAAQMKERLWEIQGVARTTPDLTAAQRSFVQAKADEAALTRQYESALAEWMGVAQSLQKSPAVQKALAAGRTLDELINTLPQFASAKAVKTRVDKLQNDLYGAQARTSVWQQRVNELQQPVPPTDSTRRVDPSTIPADQWGGIARNTEAKSGREAMLAMLAQNWQKIPDPGRQAILSDSELHLIDAEKQRVQGTSQEVVPPATPAPKSTPAPPAAPRGARSPVDRRERSAGDAQTDPVVQDVIRRVKQRLQIETGDREAPPEVQLYGAVGRRLTQIVNSIRRQYDDFVSGQSIKQDASVAALQELWGRLKTTQQREAVRREFGLSNAQVDWLNRHAQSSETVGMR